MGIPKKIRQALKIEAVQPKMTATFIESKRFAYRNGNVTLDFTLNKTKAEIIDFATLLAQAAQDVMKYAEECDKESKATTASK